VTLKILADDRYCGRVIGKEGKVIKKIREDTDTHIVVSKLVSYSIITLLCLFGIYKSWFIYHTLSEKIFVNKSNRLVFNDCHLKY